MENNKSEFSEIIGTVSKFVGAVVGSAVVTTKKIEHCLKNMMTVEAEPSGQVAAKPAVADKEVEPARRDAPQRASEASILEAEVEASPSEGRVEEATAQEDTTQPQGKKKMKAKEKREGQGKEAKIKRKTKKAKKSTHPRNCPISEEL